VYVLGVEEVDTQAYATLNPYSATRRHYPLPGGGASATRDATGLHYLAMDLLGTPLATYNLDTGALLGTQLRAPYGQPRFSARAASNGGMHTTVGFTGQREDSGGSGAGVGASGLDDFHARSYDPAVGRFASADSVSWSDALGDAYAYVVGRVEVATDPSGHEPPNQTDEGVYNETPDTPSGVKWQLSHLLRFNLAEYDLLNPDLTVRELGGNVTAVEASTADDRILLGTYDDATGEITDKSVINPDSDVGSRALHSMEEREEEVRLAYGEPEGDLFRGENPRGAPETPTATSTETSTTSPTTPTEPVQPSGPTTGGGGGTGGPDGWSGITGGQVDVMFGSVRQTAAGPLTSGGRSTTTSTRRCRIPGVPCGSDTAAVASNTSVLRMAPSNSARIAKMPATGLRPSRFDSPGVRSPSTTCWRTLPGCDRSVPAEA